MLPPLRTIRSRLLLGTDANGYNNWWIDHLFLLVPAQTHVAEQLATFAKFPPRQKPAKFNVEEVLNNLMKAKNN